MKPELAFTNLSLDDNSIQTRRPQEHVLSLSAGLSPETSVPTALSSKPRVLIIPNTASWIIGQMAMQIINQFGDLYDFWFVTDKIVKLRPDLIRALAPTLDFIFPLGDKGYQLVKQAIHPLTLPSIFWVHHVTTLNPSMQATMESSAELIVCTEDWKRNIETQAPAHSSITVVRHGVDLQEFSRRDVPRSRFGIPSSAFVVGFVGSKTSDYDGGRKGLDTLDRVLKSLRGRIPNLHISFLGLGWESECRRLRSAGISANYAGFIPQSQLAEFYSCLDTYLLTSRVEGGPCTVLEAMACETPVVATRVGLVPQTIKDGINGFSTEVDDAEALAAAVSTLVSSRSIRREIGKAARATMESGLSWAETLKNLEEPLRRMALRSPRFGRQYRPHSSNMSQHLCSAVHVLDGFLSSALHWRRGLTGPRVSVRMLRACLEGSRTADMLRAVGLASGLYFRPASIREEM